MANIDINKLSSAEINELFAALAARKAENDAKERAAAIEAFKQAVEKYSIKPEEINFIFSKPKAERKQKTEKDPNAQKPVGAKVYKDPNSDATHTGKGMPKWMREYIKNGGNKEDLLVSPQNEPKTE